MHYIHTSKKWAKQNINSSRENFRLYFSKSHVVSRKEHDIMNIKQKEFTCQTLKE
jgi:hypothetical protein